MLEGKTEVTRNFLNEFCLSFCNTCRFEMIVEYLVVLGVVQCFHGKMIFCKTFFKDLLTLFLR
jgi:hypothetical protein